MSVVPADLWLKAEALCRAVAPHEMPASTPLYIVGQSSRTGPEGGGKVIGGYTHPRLQESLGERWRGRGPAMVVNDHLLGPNPEDVEFELVRVVLHEWAHILIRGVPRYLRPPTQSPEEIVFERLIVNQLVAAPDTEPRDTTRRVYKRLLLGDVFDHEAFRFGRVVCHLTYRARAWLGWRISPAVVWNSNCYVGLTHGWQYEQALGDEPERFAGKPLADVLAAPAPAAFLALWRADLGALDALLEDYVSRLYPEDPAHDAGKDPGTDRPEAEAAGADARG